MKIHVPFTLLIIVAAVLVSGCASDDARSGDVDAFVAALEADGFVVQEGKLEIFPVLEMYDAGIVPSCYGNNPSTPYLIYKLPEAPGQTAPNLVSDAPINPENRGLWIDYRLREDEAIVFVGATPPPIDYYSYRSYIVNRWFPAENRSRRIFASLGDTLNLGTIKTSGPSDNPFNQTTMIITAADVSINARVRAAANGAGFSSSLINDDVIPSQLVRMGLDRESDTFGFIHRLAFFHDEDIGSVYLNSNPGRVFRLTPTTESAPVDPFAVPALRIRGTGTTEELDLLPQLDALEDAILARYGPENATMLGTSIWLLEGYDAIQRGVDVIGENRDTVYLRSENFTLGDDPDEFLIVYGVNHAAAGKAVYSNFGIYGADILNGVDAVSNHDFTGSAGAYLPKNPDAAYLYVYKVARHAGGDPACLEVSAEGGASGIGPDQEAFVGFRAYLEEETLVGPYWSELVYDRVILFASGT